MSPEFALIEQYFTRAPRHAALGVGDDCALWSPAAGFELALSTDTLVSGTHFFPDADPHGLGHKALAVNLSDLAAMGAIPRAALLALTLPRVEPAWLEAFAAGFWALAEAFDVDLVGGDTTRGPLSITLTVLGEVEQGRALRRDGAKAGDDLWVSGDLGGAALALRLVQGLCADPVADVEALKVRLNRPQPRVALGRALLPIAHAMIDVSDGLVADVGHLCERSGLGAEIEWSRVPMPDGLRDVQESLRLACVLAGGDDYELAFAAPAAQRSAVEALGGVTRIGSMVAGVEGVRVLDASGSPIRVERPGFDHFGHAS
ncbi:MAG: thiamine-phosphate kinase [Betaproteobacteria bacterium]|nr:thiamine-phosphate kinase [Betaproteobacteria bacterium]